MLCDILRVGEVNGELEGVDFDRMFVTCTAGEVNDVELVGVVGSAELVFIKDNVSFSKKLTAALMVANANLYFNQINQVSGILHFLFFSFFHLLTRALAVPYVIIGSVQHKKSDLPYEIPENERSHRPVAESFHQLSHKILQRPHQINHVSFFSVLVHRL